ncbi:MAG: O-antigen ligase family protein, partial [Candidatus Omnitrophota bacterium]|nr:O-antigen ligase family protein [Candidatus Omnitrophota bacterium]
VLLLITAMIVLSVLMLTNSKGAWFAFLAALLFSGFYIKKRYVLYILLVLFVIGLILPAVFNFSSINLVKRMASFSGDAGAIDRKFLWLAALRMFYAKPLFGVGLGTFMENYQRFWLKPTTEIAYAHNCYLQALAETGFIGLGAFLLLLFIWLKETLGRLLRPSNSFYYFSFMGLSVGLVAYLLNSFVDTNFYSLPIAVLFWFILGLQQAAGRLANRE